MQSLKATGKQVRLGSGLGTAQWQRELGFHAEHTEQNTIRKEDAE